MQILSSAFFLFLWGPYFGTYLLYRNAAHGLARGALFNQPAALFFVSILLGYAWVVGTTVCLYISIYIIGMLTPGDWWGLWVIVSIVSVIVGPIGWIVLAVKRGARLSRYKVFRRLHPEPKLQFWLQDIMVGAFALGLTMTIYMNLRDRINDPTASAGFAAYEIVSQFVLFFAALDALRFSTRLTVPRDRALYLFMLMMVNALLPLPLLTALSWNVWKRAKFLTDEEFPRTEETKAGA